MLRNGIVWTLIVLVFALGCAKRPVLYPNDHLESVGKEASQHDIDVCMALAKDADLGTNQTLEAGKKTGAGAAVGALVVAPARMRTIACSAVLDRSPIHSLWSAAAATDVATRKVS